jgi:membrane fusion protein (multidrug efflux system)
MKRIITIVVIVVIAGIVAFRLASNKKEIDSRNIVKDNTNLTVAVNVAKVVSRTNEKNLVLVGTVTALQVIDIKSEVQGKITGLYFALGDYVPRGKTIARIDDQIRQLAVSNAEQSLADAQQNFERYKRLYEGGGATKAQLDQYTLALENAKNKLQQTKKELSNAVIAAPFSGYITARSIENGAFVNVGAPIATIIDVSQLKVQLNVPERDVYALKVGDPVTITTTVYPGITYKGTINFIGYQGDASHNYPVEISIVNQKNYSLKAGTYVDIAFNRKSLVPTLQIPREALVGSIKNAKVYVITAGSIARLKPITVGNDNGNFLEVVSGLSEGENVVTSGHINLGDSTRVSIIK